MTGHPRSTFAAKGGPNENPVRPAPEPFRLAVDGDK